MPKPIRILGIDPGSKLVGFACIETRVGRSISPRDFSIVDVGVLRAPPQLPHAVRIGILHDALLTIISDTSPTICVMERAFTGVNSFTALRLGEARGALISALRSKEICLEEVAPAHVKKTIAGNGAATKEEVARVLSLLWKFERGSLPYDTTDALAIALTFGLRPAPASGATVIPTRPARGKRQIIRSIDDFGG